jgi:hypothetical protein
LTFTKNCLPPPHYTSSTEENKECLNEDIRARYEDCWKRRAKYFGPAAKF